jgi:hypothetical protein
LPVAAVRHTDRKEGETLVLELFFRKRRNVIFVIATLKCCHLLDSDDDTLSRALRYIASPASPLPSNHHNHSFSLIVNFSPSCRLPAISANSPALQPIPPNDKSHPSSLSSRPTTLPRLPLMPLPPPPCVPRCPPMFKQISSASACGCASPCPKAIRPPAPAPSSCGRTPLGPARRRRRRRRQ